MTFGLGFFEILLILVLVVILVPPKHIPIIMRKSAQIFKRINKSIKEFIKELEE